MKPEKQVEILVERLGVCGVVQLLAEACYDQADRLASDWHTAPLADAQARNGKLLFKVQRKLTTI